MTAIDPIAADIADVEAIVARARKALCKQMTGMFVKVHIHTSPPISLLRIPQQAVQPEEKVWVVDGNVLMQKTVTIAYSTDDYAVVIEQPDGLKAGDSIIVSPLAQPSVGMKVVPVGGPARPAGNGPPTGGQPAVTSGGP